MKVLYLYTELMGYNIPIFERLVTHYGATVDVVHWSKNKLTPFVPHDHINNPQIRFHDRSRMTSRSIKDLAINNLPDVVYVGGWMDRGYFPALRKLKQLGVPIVMGLDSQWVGSVRHHLGALLIRWVYKPLYYSFAWVPGPLQYEYAARIGFKKSEILFNLLSGNSELFAKAAQQLEMDKLARYPQNFLYVGRFAEAKGIDILISAFDIYKEKYQGAWGLTCIGNGPKASILSDAVRRHKDLRVETFLSQDELVCRGREAGAFVLPSRYEPWGVVVHEFSTAGLPLILSEYVGARPQLLIDELNGYTFYDESPEDLAYKMHTMSKNSNERLIDMGRRSAQLANHITPDVATASLMSVLSLSQDRL